MTTTFSALPADKTNVKAVTNSGQQWTAEDCALIKAAILQLQTYLSTGTLDAAVTHTISDLDLLLTSSPSVGPEMDWGGNRGRWFMGVDVANTPTSRDFVLTGQRGTYSFNDGATTSGSATLTSVSGGGFSTAIIGATISGSGIPNGTTVTGVGSSTSLTMSSLATLSATGVTVTITRSSVIDLIYIKHRGGQQPTVGIGVTPPDGTARLQVSPDDNEVAMGTMRLRRGPSQTGKILTLHDSTPTDTLWVDKDFYMSGAHSLGGAIALQGDVTNDRPLLFVNNAKNQVYGYSFPAGGGGVLRLRSMTGGADVYQIGTDGTMFIYQPATLQFAATFQTGIINQGYQRLTNELSPAQITSNQNDYAPTGFSSASVIILTSDAARDITGFGSPVAGRTFYVYNNGAFNITLKHLTTSTAANQIIGRGAADTVLTPKTGAQVYYSGSQTKHLILGDTL